MDRQELAKLREQILSDITPIVLESVEVGADRFSLLLRLIQSGDASQNIYKMAYESAKAIEDKGEQLNALMALLDEVDFDMQNEDSVDVEAEPKPVNEQPQGEERSAAGGSDTAPPQPIENAQY